MGLTAATLLRLGIEFSTCDLMLALKMFSTLDFLLVIIIIY